MPILGPGINPAREKGDLFPCFPGCERDGMPNVFAIHAFYEGAARQVQTMCAAYFFETTEERTHAVLDCRDRVALGCLCGRVRARHRRFRSGRSAPWGERESDGGGRTSEDGQQRLIPPCVVRARVGFRSRSPPACRMSALAAVLLPPRFSGSSSPRRRA